MQCFIVFLFFSSIWWMQNIWSVVDLLHRNPHWWSRIISSAYGVKLDSIMLDKILYVVDKTDTPLQLQSILSPVSEIGIMIDSFHSSGKSSLFQVELITSWISLQIVLPLAIINAAGIWSIPSLYSFSVAISETQRHWVQALVALLHVFLSNFINPM